MRRPYELALEPINYLTQKKTHLEVQPILILLCFFWRDVCDCQRRYKGERASKEKGINPSPSAAAREIESPREECFVCRMDVKGRIQVSCMLRATAPTRHEQRAEKKRNFNASSASAAAFIWVFILHPSRRLALSLTFFTVWNPLAPSPTIHCSTPQSL